MKIKHGSYTGNGSSQTITTDIAADFVLVKGEGATDHHIALSSFPAGDSKPLLIGAMVMDGITALSGTGFSVGANAEVNSNTVVYYWVAIEAEAGDTDVGSYTGNVTDDRSITDPGFLPDVVFVIPANAGRETLWRTSDMSGDNSQRLNSVLLSNRIQAFEANGFQIGDDNDVNASGETYYYFAVKNVAVRSTVVTYAGDGSDDKSIGGYGWQPSFLMTKFGSGGNVIHTRFLDESGDASMALDSAEAANGIQAFEADGFQAGTASTVNASGTYNSWALAGSQSSQFPQVNIIG